MLKKFIITSLVVLFSFSAFIAEAGNSSHTDHANEDDHIMPSIDDRWVPWPFHLAQPFPWQSIQGVWKVESGDYVSYFAFKVVNRKVANVRQLQVKQYDGETCRIIATGVGLERNQKVFAQMTSKAGMTYRVQLTALSKEDSPVQPAEGVVPFEEVMVLSMGSLEVGSPQEMHHMQIVKISPLLTLKQCLEDVKK